MEARRPEQSQTLTTLANRSETVLHLVLKVKARSCAEIFSTETTQVEEAATEDLAAVRLMSAPSEGSLCHHNIGATLMLCSRVILSWVKDKSAAKEFRIILPGTKTVVTYDPKTQILAICDEMMEVHYDPSKDHPRSHLPNPTDPRVASVLYMLLEETCNARERNLSDIVSGLEFHHTEMQYSEEQKQALVKELDALGIFKRERCAENYHPKRHLYAIKVTGIIDIMRLAYTFEHAFGRHKGRIIPLEPDAEKTLRHTL